MFRRVFGQQRMVIYAGMGAAVVFASSISSPVWANSTAPPQGRKESLRPFRSSLSLDDATSIIDRSLHLRRQQNPPFLPLAVAVLDAGGGLVALKREDGCAIMRTDIAIGKAYGALSMGMPTRQLRDRLSGRPSFMASLTGIGNRVGKGWVAVPGGVLILDQEGFVVGAVGISGDTSDKDEMVAIVAINKNKGLSSDPGEPCEKWKTSSLSH